MKVEYRDIGGYRYLTIKKERRVKNFGDILIDCAMLRPQRRMTLTKLSEEIIITSQTQNRKDSS